MAKLAVPDRHTRPIRNLLRLTSSAVEKAAADVGASDQRFASIITILKGVGVEDPTSALQALASLHLAVNEYRLDEDDVRASLSEVSDGIEPANLWPLLQTVAVGRFAKAIDLRNAYEKILADSRVISDIRPVFPDDETVPAIVDAAMVNHTLRLTFFPGDRGLPGEIHIAVDTLDLKRLRDQIDRALDKERASRALIEKGGAVVLEPLEITSDDQG